MKILFALLFPAQVFALSFEVIGPCSEQPIYQTTTTLHNSNLGFVTEYLFKKDGIPYLGDQGGFRSIANSPFGDEALEVLSDSTMRSYGWCVEVDGKQPEVMPDEVMISKTVKHIRWFYAFTFYDSGKWTQFCTPSHLVKSQQICK